MAIILLLWNRAFWKKAYHLFAPLSIKGKNYLLFIVYSAVNLYMTWQVVVRNAGNWPLEARILPDLDQKIARAHSILILQRICQIQTWKMLNRVSNSIDAIWKLYLKILCFFHNGTPSKKKGTGSANVHCPIKLSIAGYSRKDFYTLRPQLLPLFVGLVMYRKITYKKALSQLLDKWLLIRFTTMTIGRNLLVLKIRLTNDKLI